MSVLYKALQKAEKENEARQSATSDSHFDPQKLAASGALKFAGGRGQAASRIVMSAIILIAVAGGAGYFVFKDTLLLSPAGSATQSPAPAAPVAAEGAPAASPTEAEPVQLAGDTPTSQPSTARSESADGAAVSDTQSAAAAPVSTPPKQDASATPSPAPSASAKTEVAAAQPPSSAQSGEKQVAAVAPAPTAVPKTPSAKPTPRAGAEKPEAMPKIPADSPARMLSPPVNISRTEFALAGVGDQVQVREVSQSARSNVASGYDALVRGSYDTALGFYDTALKDEPNSVLALLGRGASLQKLGRGGDAQLAYDAVLKIDPDNREALTNLTTIVAERAPQEALARLQELDSQYPTFSPIKAQIGLAYAKSGAMQQALEYLRRAVVLAPNASMYHYNLALVQDHLGQRVQAIASYERFLDLTSGGGADEVSRPEIERRVRYLKAR